jgi:acetylornithine deacetylase
LFGFLVSYFCSFYANETLPYNIVIVASAEEENSGKNGLNSVLKHLPELDCAIVGNPL